MLFSYTSGSFTGKGTATAIMARGSKRTEWGFKTNVDLDSSHHIDFLNDAAANAHIEARDVGEEDVLMAANYASYLKTQQGLHNEYLTEVQSQMQSHAAMLSAGIDAQVKNVRLSASVAGKQQSAVAQLAGVAHQAAKKTEQSEGVYRAYLENIKASRGIF